MSLEETERNANLIKRKLTGALSVSGGETQECKRTYRRYTQVKTVSGGDKLEDGASLESQLTVWEENRSPRLSVRRESKGQMKTVLIVKQAAPDLSPGGTSPQEGAGTKNES